MVGMNKNRAIKNFVIRVVSVLRWCTHTNIITVARVLSKLVDKWQCVKIADALQKYPLFVDTISQE